MRGRETRKGLVWRIVALVALLVAGCSNTPPDQATPLPAGTDEDGDGYTVENGDCDDSDAAIHPGADEVCDDIDNDSTGSWMTTPWTPWMCTCRKTEIPIVGARRRESVN